MKKNKQPYSEPSSVQLAFTDDLASFCTIQSRFVGDFKPNAGWHTLPDVAGSLQPNTMPEKQGTSILYNVSVKFRIAYASPVNQNELETYLHRGVIMKYKKGGGEYAVLGTKAHPLQFTFASSSEFDGYECELNGSQTTPECYSM